MKKPAGLVNQKIEIYSDQDVRNDSGGVSPNSVVYWATSANVTRMGAPRNVAQAAELLTPTFRFEVNDRIDKNVQANMLIKYRGQWFTIVSADPDYVYRDTLILIATGCKLPERSIPSPPIEYLFYYGAYDDISEVTEGLVLSWNSVPIIEGEPVIIDFINPDYKFNGFAVADSYPELNHFELVEDPLQEGDFGPGNLFENKTELGTLSLYPGGYMSPLETSLLINTI